MKITIVGGGTAGWLAALIVSKCNPQHTVTVIESPTVGIIGAGEGSTGTMTNIIQNITFDYGCNEKEFVDFCDVTPKLGIEFVDWSGDKDYYISPITGSYTASVPLDYAFLHALSTFPKNKLHLCSTDGILIEHNKDTLSQKDGPAAYHFDAHKVGKYFKKVCGDKVKHIELDVIEVNLSQKGNIESLKLSDGNLIESDFFIDATGFSRTLMSKLNCEWISYKKHLPVDRAMPFLTTYQSNEQIRPATKAWAQRNGWMWQIPLLRRKGCGYVYSSDFVTDDAAKIELEKNIGHEIDPIRIIKFDSGRLKNLWIKNCLSVGLCAAFAEPLEATSIHTTIMQLENFAKEFLQDNVDDTLIESRINDYNETFGHMYDLLKDFLVLHYRAGRSDTEFWRHVNSDATLTDFTREILEIAKIRSLNSTLFPPVAGVAGWSLWSFILGGTGNLSSTTAVKDLERFKLCKLAEFELVNFVHNTENSIIDLPDNTHAIKARQRMF
jgi:tryptophan halogenase